MSDCMNFPDNIMDFIDDYSFEDSDHVYTNGSKLIQSFRVKQAIEHYFREQEPVKPNISCDGLPGEGGTWWYVCGNCSNEIDPDDAYCRNCGKKVKWNDR